jgi:hypothetical protein
MRTSIIQVIGQTCRLGRIVVDTCESSGLNILCIFELEKERRYALILRLVVI